VAVAVALYFIRMFAVTGILSPLFLAQDLQHVALRPVPAGAASAARPCSAARCGGPTTTATTTSIPTSRGRPFAACARFLVVAHRLDHQPAQLSHRLLGKVRDLAKYPELVFLNRFDVARAGPLRRRCSGSAGLLEVWAPRPALHTSGGSCSSGASSSAPPRFFTAPSCINSLAHLMGGAASRPTTIRATASSSPRHPRRRLAQQPPPLPGRHPPGLLLVGDRHHLRIYEEAARNRSTASTFSRPVQTAAVAAYPRRDTPGPDRS
jgi:hypothetical protein